MSETTKRAVEVGTGLRLSMPSPRPVFQQVFLGLWLLVWLPSGAMVLWILATGAAGERQGFLVLWLVGWWFGAANVLVQWLWAMCGREIVIVAGRTLALRREVFGFGWTREFNTANVAAIRAEPEPWWAGSRGRGPWANEGHLAFDCGGRTVRFGGGLDVAEAEAVVDELQTGLAASTDAGAAPSPLR